MQLVLPAEYLTLQFPVSKTPEKHKVGDFAPQRVLSAPASARATQGSPSPLSPGDAEKLLLAPAPNIVENQKLEIFWEEFLQA